MDDQVAQFIELTGASDEIARHYLEMCEFDAGKAVELFLEHDQPPLRPASPPPRQTVPPPAPIVRSTGFDIDFEEEETEDVSNAAANMLFK
jgi:hypothetical protein